MDSDDFNLETAKQAADALEAVFAARTHKRKHLGQIITVPGKLGEAVKLPSIIAKLNSRVGKRQESGLEDFQFLWDTLSESTRQAVLEAIGWYQPDELEWDDKRSNMKPKLTE